MGKVTITKGQDFEYTLRLTQDGKPKKLVGWSLIKIRKKKEDGTVLELFAPLSASADEVQTVSFPADPASGSYKLQHPTTGEKTAAIQWNDTAGTVQTLLRAIKVFSDLTVSGDQTQAGGLTINYIGKDGGRDQDLLVVTDNTLQDVGASALVPVVATTTPGKAAEGIDVVDQETGEIKVKGSEAETALLEEGDGQTGVLIVRIGAQDLNIPPLTDLYDVKPDPLA